MGIVALCLIITGTQGRTNRRIKVQTNLGIKQDTISKINTNKG
jgi:hypothetical protein